jgi:hypothetical protein
MPDWLAEGCPDELVIKPPPPGVPVNALAATQILLDLIAELRRSAKGYLSPGAYAITVKEQLWLADWAEARLREVGAPNV